MSKVWFITGTSKGFGRAFATAALKRGDQVVATARDTAALDDLFDNYGDAVLPLQLDVTDKAAGEAALAAAVERFGRLDVLVNNAGYGLMGMVEEVSEHELRDQMETNFFAAVWLTQAALPIMRENGGGRIVQISSVSGVMAFPSLGLYSASKFALEAFSEALAGEVAGQNIKVTIVEPAGYATEWGTSSLKQTTPAPQYDDLRAQMSGGDGGAMDFGDPAAAAQALLQVVDADEPPVRVFFGNTALAMTRPVYEQRLQTWEQWDGVAQAAHR